MKAKIMPYGKYRGKPIRSIPPDYLLHVMYTGQVYGETKRYLESIKTTLEQKLTEIEI